MSLADSKNAIGALTRLVKNHLVNRTGEQVTVGKPEDAAGNTSSAQTNLFLYEIEFDGSMKNLALNPGDLPAIWLVLKYALTCFDGTGKSDTPESHDLLGTAILALQEMAYVPLDGLLPANVQQPLKKNPEPLKLSFDAGNVDLLSKLMQGSDEKYRLSCLFQVRPIMIVPGEPPSLSQLVGIDYTQPGQPTVETAESVLIEALPSLGPALESVSPGSVDAVGTINIEGSALGSENLEVLLDTEALTIHSNTGHALACSLPTAISNGSTLSPGSHPLKAREALSGGKFRSSNLLELRLRPSVASASKSGITTGSGMITGGQIDISGSLLGKEDDDATLAFYANGKVVKSFDVLTAAADQTSRSLSLSAADGLPTGSYRIIYRVNGQQAHQSPEIDLSS